MRVVVSDTSPIRALHHLGLLPLVHQLFQTVLIPPTVVKELAASNRYCAAIEACDLSKFTVKKTHTDPNVLGVPLDLDEGEREAIALALESNADLLIIDERKGRRAAIRLGLTAMGVLGILLEAKKKGLIKRVVPLIDSLINELNFRVSARLRKQLADLANE